MKRKFNFIEQLPSLILASGVGVIAFWFGHYLTDRAVPGWDLPGHIVLVERLAEQILFGRVTFYDRWWFTGWVAYEFYAPLGHVLTALFSLILKLFFADSARAAVHIVLLSSIALLPLSMWFAAKGFLPHQEVKVSYLQQSIVALASVALSVWFLNHDHQWFGIGAAAVMYIGLFAQVFAWHLLLLHWGMLARSSSWKRERWIATTALLAGMLFLVHSLSAVFSFAVALCFWWWQPQYRKQTAYAHMLALLLAAVWLVPFVLQSSTYVVLDIHRPSGDILELFLRYPFSGLIKTFAAFFAGAVIRIDYSVLVLWGLLTFMLFNKQIRANQAMRFFALTSLVLYLIFSSGFIASSLPVGFHYYRFNAYVFLLVCLLIAAVPVVLMREGKKQERGGIALPLLGFAYASILISPIFFPHYEYKKVRNGYGTNGLVNEEKLIDYFSERGQKGRVFIEYNTDGRRFPFLSPHYLESEIPRRSGFETINGLYIQSSIAYRMPVVSANLLGAKTFNVPLLFTDRSRLDDQTKLQQLIDLGTTHIVAGSERFAARLQDVSGITPKQFGPYALFELQSSAGQVAAVTKPILGYYDSSGDLSFKFLQFYFFARAKLYNNYTLLSLRSLEDIPKGLAGLIVNNAAGNFINIPSSVPRIELAYKSTYKLDHYAVQYQHNVELDAFNDVERYLDQVYRMEQRVVASVSPTGEQHSDNPLPILTWLPDTQSFKLSQLKVGKWYSINYSYFPYWESTSCELYRGLLERILVRCNSSEAVLSYNPRNRISWWSGLILSVLALLMIGRSLGIGSRKKR